MGKAGHIRRTVLSAALVIAAVAAPCESTASAAASPTEGALADAGARVRFEIERRGDAIMARRAFDGGGALVEESYYGNDGILSEKRTYIRLMGRLSRVEVSDADGKLRGIIEYRYDGNGRLISVSPSGSLGSGPAGMIASGAAPSGSWMTSGAAIVVQRFDERGRPVRVETVAKGNTIATASYVYGEGRFPERSLEEDLAKDALTVSDFDNQGRILKRIKSSKGVERSRSEFRYDEAGKLVEERSRISGSLLVRNLEYDGSGALVREVKRIDGVISETTEHREGSTIVERYHEGQLFVRSYFSNGRKVRDEFYDDGTILRSREYP
jgi:YD repeat-containing protein